MSSLPHVIIPDSGADLLRQELDMAFSGLGCRVTRFLPEVPRAVTASAGGSTLAQASGAGRPAAAEGAGTSPLEDLLAGGPALLFSVNFQGLGDMRRTLELLERFGARAAVWCVDNPWNLLAGVRDPRWKGLDLFVTDATFIRPLLRHGAERVRHLPLAACDAVMRPNPARDAAFPPPADLAPFVFAGRSAFPGKASFFSGQEVPERLLAAARDLLPRGERPDLLWWEAALGCADAVFWPGKKARCPALGAEESSLLWRAACLAAAAQTGRGERNLDIFGDAGWGALLPEGARLLPPVDYYARLPGIYAAARYSLCLTSLQLPGGLNQRHFDVWTAGGVCLTDATPGLALFPEELTRPVTFVRPEGIARTAERIEASPGGRAALVRDWRAVLANGHSYAHRARQVLETVWK